MPLPAPLLRRNPKAHKNDFGHVLILAGSRNMVGAAALTSLAAIRSGAGLVTIGIPQSLNSVIQKKIASVIMTLPLAETKDQTLSNRAYPQLIKKLKLFDVIALGPGLSDNSSTQKLICKIVATLKKSLVIDADALNAVAKNISTLKKGRGVKILTPHPGEMARLTGLTKQAIEKNRQKTAKNFARKYNCVLLLKGHQTVVASPTGKIYINKTGNSGMATAGSGDVLTGMIAAFVAQGLSGFEAAKWGSYLHGKAGDLAARETTKTSLIATDIVNSISKAMKKL